MRKNGVLTYLHADHLGSTVMETNPSAALRASASGALTTDEKYFAYGKQRDSGKVTTDHRFTGQKQDGSGLMYYGARYYDPQIGLFVSPDTIVPDAGNVFAYNRSMYVYGRVMNANDPSGHTPCTNQGSCIQDPDNPYYLGNSRVSSCSPTRTCAKHLIVESFKSNFGSPVAKNLIDHYADGMGSLYKLSEQEMIEIYPVISLLNSDEFNQAYNDLMQQGGGTIENLIIGGDAGARANGTLASFHVDYKGTLIVKGSEWAFEGEMTFSDIYDFDAKPAGARTDYNEFKTTVGRVLLPGQPFPVTSEALSVEQSSFVPGEAQWSGTGNAATAGSSPTSDFFMSRFGHEFK